MKKIYLIICLVFILASGCAKDTLFTEDTFPKIDGSTALYPLSVEFAKETIGINTDEAEKMIHHNKTHESYVNLINKKADIILASEPSDEELQMAADNGVELEMHPFAKDAFVFMVNKNNPIEELSIAEIQDIYQGKITNWSQVGGSNEKITAFQRPQNSGSQTTMEKKIMQGKDLMKPPSEAIIGGMGGLIEKVNDYDNAKEAIGYSFYYYATTMYPKNNIKFLKINGIKPEKETIQNDSYPFSGTGYIVIRKDEAKDSPSRKLLQWILSEDGQKAVERVGYVPVK